MSRRAEEPRDVREAIALEAEEAGPPGPDGELEPGPDSGSGGRPLLGSFGATATIQILQAVTGVLLARILGPSGRGELAAVVLWPTLIVVIGSLGLSQASTYFVARAGGRAEEGTVVGTTLALAAVVSLGLVAISSLLVPFVLSGQEDEVVATARVFLLAYIPFNLISVMAMSLLNGQHRFAWFQGLRILVALLLTSGIVAFDLLGELSVQTGATVYALAYLVAMVLGLTALVRPLRDVLRVTRARGRELLSFGVKSQLSVGMWNLNERGDQLIISVFFDPTSLGLYVVAVMTTSVTTIIGFSAALVALPIVARIADPVERRRTVSGLIGATMAAAIAVTVPIFMLEPWLIETFFGSDFAGSVGVGRVLLVGAIFFGLNRALEAVLQAVGRPLESSIGEAVALVVTAIGLAILLPTVGIMGAGITSLVAYAASALFLSQRVTRALEMSPRELLVPGREALAMVVATFRRPRGIEPGA